MNNPPADDQLDQISGSYIFTVLEHGDWVHVRLVFDTAFKFFYDMFRQFPVNNQFSHPLPVLNTCRKF